MQGEVHRQEGYKEMMTAHKGALTRHAASWALELHHLPALKVVRSCLLPCHPLALQYDDRADGIKGRHLLRLQFALSSNLLATTDL